MERYSERSRHGNVIGVQRTVAADGAMHSGTHLQVVIEEEGCLSAAQSPAAAAPDTRNCEIAQKLLVGCMAQGVVVSGHGL